MTTAGERLDAIGQRIADAARRAGRTPQQVRLIAVSKTQSLTAMQSLVDLGVHDFGESQVQEALAEDATLPGRGAELALHRPFAGQ